MKTNAVSKQNSVSRSIFTLPRAYGVVMDNKE